MGGVSDTICVARLTITEVDELIRLYQDEGWHVMHLSRYYRMPHASIQHHLQGVTRRVKPIEYCPDEVVEASSHVSGWKMNRPKYHRTYEEYLAEDEKRRMAKRAQCTHNDVIVVCKCCGEHLEETKTHKAKVKVTFL